MGVKYSMEFLTILTTIGGICGTLVTIFGFFALIFKKPKEWLKKMIIATHNEQMQETVEILKRIENTLSDQQQANICALRHSITGIYETFKEEKYLPINVKQDLCSLYEIYTKLGGNSYVHEIYETMCTWEVK